MNILAAEQLVENDNAGWWGQSCFPKYMITHTNHSKQIPSFYGTFQHKLQNPLSFTASVPGYFFIFKTGSHKLKSLSTVRLGN